MIPGLTHSGQVDEAMLTWQLREQLRAVHRQQAEICLGMLISTTRYFKK